jgi:Raf kinase inhibitor-like YbhB/YbcL family protein
MNMRAQNLTLTSPAFEQGQPIPDRYTCYGEDINPSLIISHVPSTCKTLAMIVDDPDAPAGTWSHWVVWNITPETSRIPEGTAPEGSVQGVNDFHRSGYGGPCPPSGTHRYFFRLFALDRRLPLGPDATRRSLLAALKGHVVAEAELMGTYTRTGKL